MAAQNIINAAAAAAAAAAQKNQPVDDTQVMADKQSVHCQTDDISTVSDVVEEAVNTILSLKSNNETVSTSEVAENTDKSMKKENLKEEIQEDPANDLLAAKNELEVHRIKSGWTLGNCGNLTVGELYLMV